MLTQLFHLHNNKILENEHAISEMFSYAIHGALVEFGARGDTKYFNVT
jgi:hypothetical protein